MPMLMAFFVLLGVAAATPGCSRSPSCRRLVRRLCRNVGRAKWVIAYRGLAGIGRRGRGQRAFRASKTRTLGAAARASISVPLAATVRSFLRALDRVGVIVPHHHRDGYRALRARPSRASIGGARCGCRRPLLVTVLWFEALSSHTQYHLSRRARAARPWPLRSSLAATLIVHAAAAEPAGIVESAGNAASEACAAAFQARRPLGCAARGLPLNKIVEKLFAAVHCALFMTPAKTRVHAPRGASLRRGYSVCVTKL